MSQKNKTKHIVCEPIKPVPLPANVKEEDEKSATPVTPTSSKKRGKKHPSTSSDISPDAQFTAIIQKIRTAIDTPEAKRVDLFHHIPQEVEALLRKHKPLREQLHRLITSSHPDSQDDLKSLFRRFGQCRQSIQSICHLIRDVGKLAELIGHIESLQEIVALITNVIESPANSSGSHSDWKRWAEQPPEPPG